MRSNLIKVFAVLGCLLLVWLLSQSLERYEKKIDRGWSDRAVRNSYLAMHLFLEKHIQHVDSVSQFTPSQISDDLTVLLLPNASNVRLPSQQREVLQWVYDGGNLIVGLDKRAQSSLLRELGFSRTWLAPEKADGSTEDEEEWEEDKSLAEILRDENEKLRKQLKQEDELPECQSLFTPCNAHVEPDEKDVSPVFLNFEGERNELKVNFLWGDHITHAGFGNDNSNLDDVVENPKGIEPFYWEGDSGGVHFAQSYYGDGLVTVISNFEIWDNSHIAHFDHAYLLDVILHRNDKALIFYGKNVPSLDVLVYENFFEALISFVLLMLLVLTYYSRRFGPVFALTEPPRRSRSEQFSALAKFRWKINDGESLIDHIREDIRKQATRQWHDFESWNASTQNTRLAELSNLPITTIEKIMNDELEFNESEFTHIIRALQIVRNSL